ncbi:MAG: hypothetical protein ABIO79_12085, partial [Ferruginibacter sp.]
DMLTKLTGQYTDKMAISNGMQLSQSEYEIALIQGELNSRIKKEMPQSETRRIFNKIKSILPVWNRYFDSPQFSKHKNKNPGFT